MKKAHPGQKCRLDRLLPLSLKKINYNEQREGSQTTPAGVVSDIDGSAGL
jgi:hypothetical protein